MYIKIRNSQAQGILDRLRSGDSDTVASIAELLQKEVDLDNQLAERDDNRPRIEEEHFEPFLTYVAKLPQDISFAKSGLGRLTPVSVWWKDHAGLTVEVYGASYSYYLYCYPSPCWVQAITDMSDELNNFGGMGPITPRQILETIIPRIKWSTEHEAILLRCLPERYEKFRGTLRLKVTPK